MSPLLLFLTMLALVAAEPANYWTNEAFMQENKIIAVPRQGRGAVRAINKIGVENVYDASYAQSNFQKLVTDSAKIIIEEMDTFQIEDTAVITSDIEIESDLMVSWKCPASGNALITVSNGAKVKITGMHLTECLIEKPYVSAIVVLEASQLELLDIKFDFNKNEMGSGLIWIAYNSTLLVEDSVFEQNSSSTNGTIIHITDAGKCVLSSCSFTSNSASVRGGAVFINSGSLDAQKCSFTKNYAGYGGAIFAEYSNVALSKCDFLENSAGNQGGALLVISTVLKDDKSRFISNIATGEYGYNGYGGAIFTNHSSEVNICKSLFETNSADQGGAVYFLETNVLAETVTFTTNDAVEGGAVHAIRESVLHEGGNPTFVAVRFVDTAFTFNTASYGGAVYVEKNQTVEFLNSDLDRNEAYYGGGSIYAKTLAKLYLDDCRLTENHVTKYDGGAVDLAPEAELNANATIFKSNTAVRHGGAIFMNKRSDAILLDCKFEENKADGSGGAIYVTAKATLADTDSSFVNNDCGVEGNDIYTEST